MPTSHVVALWEAHGRQNCARGQQGRFARPNIEGDVHCPTVQDANRMLAQVRFDMLCRSGTHVAEAVGAGGSNRNTCLQEVPETVAPPHDECAAPHAGCGPL